MLRLLRLVNPLVRAVLRSPLHPLLSGSLAVLDYRGRRSGRLFAIPVLYAEHEEAFVVLAATPERKRWWRTFREPAPATLLVRGAAHAVEGRVLEGSERRDALRAWLGRFPRASRPVGLAARSGDAELDASRAVVVGFAATDRSA